ncbi:MAG TPA: hypothetical protein VKR52_10890 [Terracidiphilus sp.]|nr:hypothetical protein [Terracidiphilus sp.]
MKDRGEKNGSRNELEVVDPALEQTLRDFKANVHAWSEAEFNRPRMPKAVVRRTWRMAAGWSLAAVLVGGAVSGGFYERQQHQRELANIAAARAAAQEHAMAEAQAKARTQAEDDLLANVDSDVSQEVPNALEPLAALSTQAQSR